MTFWNTASIWRLSQYDHLKNKAYQFKFKSSSFNTAQYLSFYPPRALRKGRDGTLRSIDAWSESFSRIAIQNWIDKSRKNGRNYFRKKILDMKNKVFK